MYLKFCLAPLPVFQLYFKGVVTDVASQLQRVTLLPRNFIFDEKPIVRGLYPKAERKPLQEG